MNNNTETLIITTQTTTTIYLNLAWSEILLVLLMAVISAVTVVGNLVVLLSFLLDRQIRQPSNFFIFSLAVSDLVSNKNKLGIFMVILKKKVYRRFSPKTWSR